MSTKHFPRAYKLGGATLGVNGVLAGRKEAEWADKKGRWTWMQLTGKRGKSILVVSAYRVSQVYPKEAGYSQRHIRTSIELVSKKMPQTQNLKRKYWMTWKHVSLPRGPLIRAPV